MKGFQKGHPNYSIDWNKKQKGIHHSSITEFKEGHKAWNKGKKHSEETRSKLSSAWTKERKRAHVARIIKIREKKSLEIVWKHTPQYKEWRQKVFERDDYTCQGCRQRGGILNADHIKPQSLYPKLRFVLSNGRTLCRPCHKKTPSWGIGIHNLRKKLAK